MIKLLQNLFLAFLIPTGIIACFGGSDSGEESRNVEENPRRQEEARRQEIERYLDSHGIKAQDGGRTEEDYTHGLIKLIEEQEFNESHKRILGYILDHPHTNVNARNETNATVLHIAADKGNLEVVNALLGVNGIEVNAQDEDLDTPLHLAVYKKSLEVVNALLGANGINLNLQNSDGMTALALAEAKEFTDIANTIRQAADSA